MVTVQKLLAVVVVAAAMGCGGSDDPAPQNLGFRSANSDYLGLLLATVPSDYSSSTLVFNDFRTGALETVLTGESGDPLLASGDKFIWHFNRSSGDVNYRRIAIDLAEGDGESNAPRELAPTVQEATPETSVGDPAAILDLDDGRLLLGHKSAGKLTVIDSLTGDHLETIVADFDLPNGSPLRPTDFLLRSDSEQDELIVYVLHQGLDQNYQPDGSQQIFQLRAKRGKTLTPVDQNESVNGVQGVPVSLTSPGQFLYKNSKQPLIATFCYVLSPSSCRFGFEQFDPTTMTVTKVAEFDDRYFYNGSVVESAEPNVLFASLTKRASPSERSVVRLALDPGLGSIEFTEVHKFPDQVSGCCGLYFDTSTDQLAIGSQHPTDIDRGQLLVYEVGKLGEENRLADTIDLPGNPAAGLLLPKAQ